MLTDKPKKMIKIAYISVLCAVFLISAGNVQAQSTSLDAIYRDLVRSDNLGYLPIYIKNRNAPEFIIDEERAKKSQEGQEIYQLKDQNLIINFEDNRIDQDEVDRMNALKWQQTIQAVKNNMVTPKELDEIKNRIKQNNPDAIEIYAYMNAKGIGVQKDFIKSFNLYRQAEKLGVPQAKENAIKVFKAMSPEQKQKLYNPQLGKTPNLN